MPVQPTAIVTPTVFLYGDFFKFSGPTTQNNNGTILPVPAAGTDMFILCQHFRSDDTPMHNVIPLMSVCEIVQLVPKWTHNSLVVHLSILHRSFI